MSDTIKYNKWIAIDNNVEEMWINHETRFTRPIKSKTYSCFCSVCKNIIGSIQDFDTIKEFDCCESCYTLYYYPNKNKWNDGWRPDLNNE